MRFRPVYIPPLDKDDLSGTKPVKVPPKPKSKERKKSTKKDESKS